MKVILKRGLINIDHFAHEHGSDCDSDFKTPDMSEWHRCRQSLFIKRCREVTIIDKETGEKHRADVMIYNKYVIEFQHSSISAEEFERRNEFYNRCGYVVIWIFDLSSISDNISVYWYYKNYTIYKWKWAWRIWQNCDLDSGDVILLFEFKNNNRKELLTKKCWERVISATQEDYYDEDDNEAFSLLSFSEFKVAKYELSNRMAFKTRDELDKLTSYCNKCGRLLHKYKMRSVYKFYYKCYCYKYDFDF